VDDAEIHRIARILASDSSAIEQKEQIHGELGLKLADLADLKQAVDRDRSGVYGFFVGTLSKYKSLNSSKVATEESLIACFTNLNLVSVVGESVIIADYNIT
jgi:hypothetical protein